MTTLFAMQASWMPWLGFFAALRRCDIFVLRDDVPIGGPSWRHRNRLKGPKGPQWMTLPLKRASMPQGDATPITQVELQEGWPEAHRRLLRGLYLGCEFYDEAVGLFDAVVKNSRNDNLASVAAMSMWTALDRLGAAGEKPDHWRYASTVVGHGTPWQPDQPNERLIAICQLLGVDRYLAVPASRDYMDDAKWRAAGIAVEFFEFTHPVYPQRFPPFASHLSVLDAIANVGYEGTRRLLGQ